MPREPHHRHIGLVGRLAQAGEAAALEPHPDAVRPDARVVWVPLAGEEHAAAQRRKPGIRDGSAAGGAVGEGAVSISDVPLEGLLCVPTRPGAMRVVAVPHIAQHLAFGDELAVLERGDTLLARGELANALAGTLRIVIAPAADITWRELARLIDAAAAGDGGEQCWFDIIAERAMAASVPRDALAGVFDALRHRAATGELAWEYATPQRHV